MPPFTLSTSTRGQSSDPSIAQNPGSPTYRHSSPGGNSKNPLASYSSCELYLRFEIIAYFASWKGRGKKAWRLTMIIKKKRKGRRYLLVGWVVAFTMDRLARFEVDPLLSVLPVSLSSFIARSYSREVEPWPRDFHFRWSPLWPYLGNSREVLSFINEMVSDTSRCGGGDDISSLCFLVQRSEFFR